MIYENKHCISLVNLYTMNKTTHLSFIMYSINFGNGFKILVWKVCACVCADMFMLKGEKAG
jgi:hypothetical protein